LLDKKTQAAVDDAFVEQVEAEFCRVQKERGIALPKLRTRSDSSNSSEQGMLRSRKRLAGKKIPPPTVDISFLHD
jgi:hypothetical protein